MRKIWRKLSNEELIYALNVNTNTRGTLVEVHIADLHLGVNRLTPEYQYNILKEQFVNKLYNLRFAILSIDGDLFDHKVMNNNKVVLYASLLIDELVNICKEKNATMVLIHGTESHDAKQLKMFYHYLNDKDLDLRIVEDVKFEYIKGAKILCIPELYGKGEDYYNYFLKGCGVYDSVFMHGEFKGAIYNNRQELGLNSPTAPVFDMDDFCLCRGPIISGHVHVANCFKKHFYYTGSPMRWQFGEEQEKGFYIVLHNLDTQQYYIEMEPIFSYRFDTINLEEELMKDPKEVIDYINKIKENGIDFIRVKFGSPTLQDAINNVKIIKQYFRNNDTVKIDADINNTRKVDKETQNKYDEYSYILDNNLNEYDILSKYINQQENSEFITPDELRSIVNDIL